jgi:putative transposase
LTGRWVPHDTRDQVVDFVTQWSRKTEVRAQSLVGWLGIAKGKYFSWVKRYGKSNEHNGAIPRDHWLQACEREAIIRFHEHFPMEGYRSSHL